MSPMIEFNDNDLLRNKLVQPAWYTLLIQDVAEWTPTKNGDSNNCVMECVIVRNADNGDTEFAGVPVYLQFNDKPKARGFIEGFLRGLGETVEAKRYDLANAKDRYIDAFVENKTWEGRVSNTVNHKYRQVRTEPV